MKSAISKSILLLLAVLVLSSAASTIEKKEALPPGLELSCILVHHDKRISEYLIIIYRDDILTDTIQVDEENPVLFRLDYGHQYAVIHRASGFRERVVMVNTVVDPLTAKKKKVFDYEIEMPETGEPENTLYDLPVAVVRFDKATGKFNYSKKYQAQVRK